MSHGTAPPSRSASSFGGLAAAVLIAGIALTLWAPHVDRASQRTVVIRFAYLEAVADTGRLAPDLRSVVETGGTLIGHTIWGEPVLRVAAAYDTAAGERSIQDALSTQDVRILPLVGYAPPRPEVSLLVHHDAVRSLGRTFAGHRVVDRFVAGGFLVVESAEGFTAEEIEDLARQPGVVWVEANREAQFDAADSPNDPEYLEGHQQGLQELDPEAAWATTTGSDLVVAVLDTGMPLDHDDLEANVWSNPLEATGTSGVRDDCCDLVDDIQGYDFYDDDATFNLLDGHGSWVAGIIGARGDNEVGVTGVNWHLQLMCVQVARTALKFATKADLAKAIRYAVCHGARIVNCSWGFYELYVPKALRDAVEHARQHEAIVVASAGNHDKDLDTFRRYPACLSAGNVVTVMGTQTKEGVEAVLEGSNHGVPHVDLAAPGFAILSTEAPGHYVAHSGTSASAAFVSGALALLWGHPLARGLGHEEIIERLKGGAAPRPVLLDDQCAWEAKLDLAFIGELPLVPDDQQQELQVLLGGEVFVGPHGALSARATSETGTLLVRAAAGSPVADQLRASLGQTVLAKGRLSGVDAPDEGLHPTLLLEALSDAP